MTKEELLNDWIELRNGFEEEMDKRREEGDHTRYLYEDEVEHFSAWSKEMDYHLSRLSEDDKEWVTSSTQYI